MASQSTIGLTHLLAQTDTVGKILLATLMAMSILTWTLIVARLIQSIRTGAHTGRFLSAFWSAPSLQAVATHIDREPAREPYSRLTAHAIQASRHRGSVEGTSLSDRGSDADFLTRAIRRVINEEAERSEAGLTLLASIGSTAPFLGLFGTVWGVYHALVSIGMSGQGTLDQVAGPVGEALIMTALGLAVAVPAVLAYNFSIRRNRISLARLDSFAHELYALLTTGATLAAPGGRKCGMPPTSASAGA